MLGKLIRQAARDKLDATMRNVRPQSAGSGLPRAALIFGGGALPGIGAALAQRFAESGMHVYLTGRSAEKVEASAKVIADAGGSVSALQVDVSEPDQIKAAFDQVERDGYVVDLVVHNVGTNIPTGFLDIKPDALRRSWRSDCLSGFLIGREAMQRMLPQGRGTLLFTGASASLRGKAKFGAFAAAKAGLRSFAQSMAREFGPQGIHVAHIVIDGIVDGDRLRQFLPDLIDQQGEDGSLGTAAIAETYWQIYQQHRSAWTHELELRPFSESW